MNIWTDIDEKRVTAEEFPVVVTVDSAAGVKYAFDENEGIFFADKMFASAVSGVSAGFIPRTCGKGGKPLEVLLLCAKSIVPMSVAAARPIGVLRFENGEEMIVAAPCFDSIYGRTTSIEQVDRNVFSSMERFCNLCEGSGAIAGASGSGEAKEIVAAALVRFRSEVEKPERWLR